MEAVVLTVKPTDNGGYLFALVGKEKVLCHQNFCDFDLREAKHGDVLDIGAIDHGPRGLRGENVRWVSRSGAVHHFTGTVRSVNYTAKCAFVEPDEGGSDIMCHITEFQDYRDRESATFDALAVGSRLTGYYRQTARGLRGSDVRECEGLS